MVWNATTEQVKEIELRLNVGFKTNQELRTSNYIHPITSKLLLCPGSGPDEANVLKIYLQQYTNIICARCGAQNLPDGRTS